MNGVCCFGLQVTGCTPQVAGARDDALAFLHLSAVRFFLFDKGGPGYPYLSRVIDGLP